MDHDWNPKKPILPPPVKKDWTVTLTSHETNAKYNFIIETHERHEPEQAVLNLAKYFLDGDC